MMISSSDYPLEIEVIRGEAVESRHLVDLVICDSTGKSVASRGEAARPIYPRSAIKALQALALVESGAAEAFGFGEPEIALACASHNGEAFHLEGVRKMLSACGLSPADLECGAHLPALEADRNALARAGRTAESIHNNCSGKHAGFLAFAVHEGIETAGYVKYGHPVQRRVAAILEEVTGATHEDGNHATDGCSVPTWMIGMDKLATAFARFGVGECPKPARASAMLRIRDACVRHPRMVAGTGMFDADFMQALGGRAFTKTGAEGVFACSLPERGIGVALKCRDGATRAAELAMAHVVANLLDLEENVRNGLKQYTNPVLTNWNGIRVGEIRMKSGG